MINFLLKILSFIVYVTIIFPVALIVKLLKIKLLKVNTRF